MAISPFPRSERKTLTMKKSALRFAAVAAMVCGFLPNAFATWTYSNKILTDGDWTFNCTASGKSLTIGTIKTAGTATTLDFTDVAGDYSIVSVGKSALKNATIVKVVLPDTVTSVGESAFGTGLAEIRLSANLTSIGVNAFSGSQLTEITLPETLTSIGYQAFHKCTSLKTVTPFLPEAVTSIGYGAFEGCPIETPLVLLNPALTITESSGHGIFESSRFTTADLSKSGLTKTGDSCFMDNTALTNVILPSTLTTVSASAFYGCSKLAEVTFLSPLPTFGKYAFRSTIGDYKGRFRYPVTDATWQGAGDGYTAWDSVSAANKAIYEAAFPDGPTPVGVATFGSNCPFKCLVPVVEDIGDRVDMVVRGEPAEVGEPDPGYGTHEDVPDQTIAGSVSQFGDDGRIWYESRGYRIDVSSPEGWITGEEVLGVRSVSKKVSESGVYGLVWLWGTNGYQVAASGFNPDYGSVTQTAADYGDNFYAVDKEVTLTATAAAGVSTFGGWFGDVPAGQEKNATITVTADKAKTLIPYFPTPGWTYDSSAKTISDGYWTLSVSGSADALTVTGVKARPDGLGVLDLARPVEGGTVVAIGASAFESNKTLTEVRLPETLTTIGHDAFADCVSLTAVTPFLPATFTSIGYAAFESCPVETPLVLSNPALTTIPTKEAHGVFKGSRFTSADLSQSGVTSIGQAAFQNNTALTEVHLPESLTKIGTFAFSGCKSLTNVAPFLPATVSSLGAAAFEDCPIKTPLVLSNPDLATLPVDGTHGLFAGGRFPSADLSQSGIKTIGKIAFQDNTSLTNVFLPKTLESIDARAFRSNTALVSVDFLSLPTFNGESFLYAKGLPARFTYPADDPAWVEFIATSTESGALTPWASAGQSERTAYRAMFPTGRKPVGKMSIGGTMKWLVPVKDSGLTVLIR